MPFLSQFGSAGSGHSSLSAQGFRQRWSVGSQFGKAPGQSELPLHVGRQIPDEGSQLGFAGFVQSAPVLHFPKHIPSVSQLGEAVGHMDSGHLP